MSKTKTLINNWSLKIAMCALVAAGAPLAPSAGVAVKADSVIDTFATPDFQNGIAISSDGTLIAYTEQGTYKVHFLDSDLNLLRSTVTLTDPYQIIIDSTKTFAYMLAINGAVDAADVIVVVPALLILIRSVGDAKPSAVVWNTSRPGMSLAPGVPSTSQRMSAALL